MTMDAVHFKWDKVWDSNDVKIMLISQVTISAVPFYQIKPLFKIFNMLIPCFSIKA